MSLHSALGWLYRDLAARAADRDPVHGVADLDAVLANQERPSVVAKRRRSLAVAQQWGEVG